MRPKAVAAAEIRIELPSGGCFINPEEFSRISSGPDQFAPLSAGLFAPRRHFRSTGDAALDRDLDRGLQVIAGLFGVIPAFGFYDPDSIRFNKTDPERLIMNAFAHPESTDIVATAGTVGFGWDLFKSEMDKDPTGMTIAAVAAHEFGHVWQFFQSHRWKELATGAPLRAEVNADFLAGYYLGTRKLKKPDLKFAPAGDLFQRLGAKAEGNPNRTHGNVAERIGAAEAGFKIAYVDRRDFKHAAAAGLEYVGVKR